MTSSRYRFLLWQFIAASDSGHYDALDIDEVKLHANAGNIAEFLRKRFGSDRYIDFSVMEPEDWVELNETWANIANAVDASRKFGVENKGINLLMAYALESAQMLDRREQKAA